MRELTSPIAIRVKAGMFLGAGLLASTLLWLERPTLKAAFLLVVVTWSFCRLYYFAFYVMEHYVGPGERFSGLTAFLFDRFLLSRKASAMKRH